MNDDNHDSLTIEDDLKSLDKMAVNFDFSVWESLRKSLTLDEREALRQSSSLLESFGRNGSDEEDDNPEKNSKSRPSSFLLMLTDEERRDIEVWRQRLLNRLVYDQDYTPTESERAEINDIIEYLALKKPKENDNFHLGHLDDSGNQITEKAIGSIFFAQPNEPQSVLLKRGPVLLYGEERELIIFTNGFVFSHIALDTLTRMLLDVEGNKSSDSEGRRVAAEDDFTSEQLCQRFKDIDTNHAGSLDRAEIHNFFQSMGMPLGGIALDGIMDKFDSDSNGAVSWNDFKSMMHEMKTRRQQKTVEPTLPSANNSNNNNGPSPWMKSFGKKLKRALSRTTAASKLDDAFQMKDITKIENLGVCHSEKTRIFADSEWAHLTMAVHITGMEIPLLVTCAKPGHVDAWMEAFRACIANGSRTPIMEGDSSHPGLIVGGVRKRVRPSVAKWSGSSVDWA